MIREAGSEAIVARPDVRGRRLRLPASTVPVLLAAFSLGLLVVSPINAHASVPATVWSPPPAEGGGPDVSACSNLALDPVDVLPGTGPVASAALEADIESCRKAVAEQPDQPRLHAQLARLLARSVNWQALIRPGERTSELLVAQERAVALGYPPAMSDLAESVLKGVGGRPRSGERALRLVADAADRGYLPALVQRARFALYGGIPEATAEQVSGWLRTAAAGGVAEAAMWLAKMHREGWWVEQSAQAAEHWYREAHRLGNSGGLVEAARMYGPFETESILDLDRQAAVVREIVAGMYAQAGAGRFAEALAVARTLSARNLWPEEAPEVIDWLRLSAETGDAEAAEKLARRYEIGHGMSQDLEAAERWYLRSVELGNNDALKRLLALIEVQPSRAEAVRARLVDWYRAAFDAGDAEAGRWLADVLDGEDRARWLRKAADAGGAEAMRRLGDAYRAGTGVRMDVSAALEWYRRALGAGSERAGLILGDILLKGVVADREVDQDPSAAAAVYETTAGLGSRQAVERLVELYANGMLIPRDMAAAEHWALVQATLSREVPRFLTSAFGPYGRLADLDMEKHRAFEERWRDGLLAQALNGRETALKELAEFYEKGRSVSDPEAARHWRQAAARISSDRKGPWSELDLLRAKAALGDFRAASKIGDHFRKGETVEKDLGQARKWYEEKARLAIRAGDAFWLMSAGSALMEDVFPADARETGGRYLEMAAEHVEPWRRSLMAFRISEVYRRIGDPSQEGRWLRRSAERHDLSEALERSIEIETDETARGALISAYIERAETSQSSFMVDRLADGRTGMGRHLRHAIRILKLHLPHWDDREIWKLGDLVRETAKPDDPADLYLKWYERAARLSGYYAEKLASLYQRGEFGPPDREKASEWYWKAYETGSSDRRSGWYGRLAHLRSIVGMYAREAPSTEAGGRLAERARETLVKSLTARWQIVGDRPARNTLVELLIGWGREEEALALVAGASSDDADLLWSVAQTFAGQGRFQEAVAWMERAAAAGSVAAALRLGTMYKDGKDVGQDLFRAARYFEKAALTGNKDATEELLGFSEGLSSRGNGLPQLDDPAGLVAALERKAAEGEDWAYGLLVRLYSENSMTPRDSERAIHWARRSVEAQAKSATGQQVEAAVRFLSASVYLDLASIPDGKVAVPAGHRRGVIGVLALKGAALLRQSGRLGASEAYLQLLKIAGQGLFYRGGLDYRTVYDWLREDEKAGINAVNAALAEVHLAKDSPYSNRARGLEYLKKAGTPEAARQVAKLHAGEAGPTEAGMANGREALVWFARGAVGDNWQVKRAIAEVLPLREAGAISADDLLVFYASFIAFGSPEGAAGPLADLARDAGIERPCQQLLQSLGYYKGPIDGDFGPGSRRAAKSFADEAGRSFDPGRLDTLLVDLVRHADPLGLRSSGE